MHLIITMIIFSLLSFAAFSEQGSWSTDNTEASQGEASLSGTNQKAQAMEEEVQLIEKEEYDPMEDPIVIEPEEQQDQRGRYDEVDESTP
jgi:hypothetical protein